MTLTPADKLAAIAARRGPLEHELYSAELDLAVQLHTGVEELISGPRQRVETIKAQIKALDDERAEQERLAGAAAAQGRVQ